MVPSQNVSTLPRLYILRPKDIEVIEGGCDYNSGASRTSSNDANNIYRGNIPDNGGLWLRNKYGGALQVFRTSFYYRWILKLAKKNAEKD